ncbi:MAG: ATP-binding cassette domain-containing protein, partial [Actinobacteria bacterium]|nr:ATP-binding cassette domain-containing protein [Actinomycetota bacterium]
IARRVAYVPQNPVAPGDMSVLDFVLIGRTPYIPYLGSETADDLRAAHGVIRRLDLTDLADRPVGSLSGGEFQRAVLGRALAQGASILLLDEPTTALDVGRQAEVMELVQRLRSTRGLTVVSAMHDLTLAAQFADHLLLLREGRIVARGSASEVITEELVLTHYGARVRVLDHPEGGVVVAPSRPKGER